MKGYMSLFNKAVGGTAVETGRREVQIKLREEGQKDLSWSSPVIYLVTYFGTNPIAIHSLVSNHTQRDVK